MRRQSLVVETPAARRRFPDQFALHLWDEAVMLTGSLGERYFVKSTVISIGTLSPPQVTLSAGTLA